MAINFTHTPGENPYMRQPPKKVLEHNINGKIIAESVRLVGDNVEPGVYPLDEALKMAREQELDLVEITDRADLPVCRIVDYNKYLYEKKKREKELKKTSFKQELKEIRLTPNTDDHDFEFKLKHAEAFLKEGHKVKVMVLMRGRNMLFKHRGDAMMKEFLEKLAEISIAENDSKLEGNRMNVVLSPKKKK